MGEGLSRIYVGDKAFDDTGIFARTVDRGMHIAIALRRHRLTKKDANKERRGQLVATYGF